MVTKKNQSWSYLNHLVYIYIYIFLRFIVLRTLILSTTGHMKFEQANFDLNLLLEHSLPAL